MRFIDSNVFIYHMREDPHYSKVAHAIVRRIEDGEQAVTSSLIIAQVCGYLKWKKKSDFIPLFLSFLESLPSLSKADTVFQDFAAAKALAQRETHGAWKFWDDFVIAAQMQRLGLEEIYSSDGHFELIPSVIRVFR